MTTNTNADTTHPLPLRGQLFAHGSARAVWAAIRALPDSLQHDILRELQGRLAAAAGSPSEARVARAVAALRESADLLGRSPSVEDYRRLRATHREFSWPSDGSLRSWVGGGSWNDCLRAARLEAVVDGDVLVAALGGPFGSDEIAQAVRDCAAKLERIPSFCEYVGWARRADVQARSGRRPLSQSPFNRHGGFIGALKLAGLVDDDTLVRVPRSGRVRAGSYFLSEEACFAGIREVAKRLGRPPRTAEYMQERESIIAESERSGQPRTIPSYNALHLRWPVWDDALVAAGLPALGGRATGNGGASNKGRKAPRVSGEHVLAVLREAYGELGDPFTVTAYRKWRVEQRKRDRVARIYRRLPDYHTVWKRFGTWDSAVVQALAASADDRPPGSAPVSP